MRLNNFEKASQLENEIKDLILTNAQEKKLNEIKNLKLALINYKNYNFDNALHYFNKVNILSYEDRIKKIKCYIFTNKIKEAENEIKKYKINDDFLNGLIMYKKGFYNQALLFFKKADNINSKIYIYNCLILLKRFDEAKKIFSEDNQRKSSFFQKIEMLIDYEKYNDASNRLTKFNDCFEKFFYLGLINLKLKNYIAAHDKFLKARDYLNSSKINYYIGLSDFLNSSYISAINFFKKAIIIQDSYEYYIKSIYYLANSYYNIGEFENALINLKKLIELPENYIEISKVYFMIAQCYEKKADFRNSIDFYNKYYTLTKDKKILLKIANLAKKLKDYNYAIQIYSNFLPVKKRKNSFVLKNIAEIYFNSGAFKESLIYFKKYYFFNKSQKILLKIGLCYLNLNDLKNAKLNFLKIVESQKKTKFRDEALYWLGLIFFREKNYEKASIYFQRLFNANSSSFLTTQAIKYILIASIKRNDFNTFKKFASIYPYREEILKFTNDLKNFCKNQSCLKLLTLMPDEYFKFKIFSQINKSIKTKKVNILIELSKKYEKFFNDNPEIYYNIGKFLFKNGYKQQAITYLNHYLKLDKSSISLENIKQAAIDVINYYYKNNNFQQIIYIAEKFKNIHFTQNEVYIIGISFYNLKLNDKAKIYLQKYIENFDDKKDNLKKLFDSAFKLENLGYDNLALNGYLKFLKYAKDKSLIVEALYWVGDIYFKKEKLNKALEYFLKIKLLYKEYSKWSIQASFRAGNIFEKKGKIKKAVNEYRYIYYMLPDNDPRKIYIKKKLYKIKINNEKNK